MLLRFLMTKPKIKLLLVDDHELFNDGLKSLLAFEEHLDIVGQVFDGKDVIYNVQKHTPDIVFLDINLPHRNGMDIAKEILKDFSATKVILLTMYEDQSMIKEAKKVGVQGYILKNSSKKELLQGIYVVFEGKNYFDEKIKKDADFINKDDFAKKFTLTDREIEIIKAVKEGRSSQEIADMMFLSYLTIKTHRRNIHFKLGTSTTPELIKFAAENGI